MPSAARSKPGNRNDASESNPAITCRVLFLRHGRTDLPSRRTEWKRACLIAVAHAIHGDDALRMFQMPAQFRHRLVDAAGARVQNQVLYLISEPVTGQIHSGVETKVVGQFGNQGAHRGWTEETQTYSPQDAFTGDRVLFCLAVSGNSRRLVGRGQGRYDGSRFGSLLNPSSSQPHRNIPCPKKHRSLTSRP